MTNGSIKEKKWGCYTKSHFEFKNKKIQLALYECMSRLELGNTVYEIDQKSSSMR